MSEHREQIPQHAHGPGAPAPRSFEDALRDVVRNSPYLFVSLLLHAGVLLALWSLVEPASLVIDVERAIVATTEPDYEELLPPPPTEVLDPVPPDELVDTPVVVEEHVPEAADALTDASSTTPDSRPSTLLGTGAGLPGFGRGGPPGKLDGRGTPGPHRDAVTAALDWLAAHQSPDGSWSANAFDDECGKLGSDGPCSGRGRPVYDVGVTGLALLAFLGAGSTPSGGAYEQQVADGLRWLLDVQDPATGNFGDPRSDQHTYDHAIATLAMVEAAALSRGAFRFRKPAQRGIDHLMTLRNPGGAWRYADPASDEMRLAPNDVSVTGWVVMVLTLARDAGLDVDPVALDDALVFIEEMTDPVSGRTGYTARGGRSARPPGVADVWPADRTEAMTAVALLCRIFADPGLERPGNAEMVDKGVALLTAAPITWGDDPAARDFYYWYYGSYALFQVGRAPWRDWQERMTVIVEQQVPEGEARGSWDPAHDPWGADGGRVYSTAILALTLEVYYRYGSVMGAHG